MFAKKYITYSMMFLFCITTSMASYTMQRLVLVKKQDDLQALSREERVSFRNYQAKLKEGDRTGAHKILVNTIFEGSPELGCLYCKEQLKLLSKYCAGEIT